MGDSRNVGLHKGNGRLHEGKIGQGNGRLQEGQKIELRHSRLLYWVAMR